MSLDYKERFRDRLSKDDASDGENLKRKRFFDESPEEDISSAVTSDPVYDEFKSNLVAVVGNLPEEKVRLLYSITGSNIAEAVNRVLDNNLELTPTPTTSSLAALSVKTKDDGDNDCEITDVREPIPGQARSSESSTPAEAQVEQSCDPRDKFWLGSFDATGWATRSGKGLLNYKEQVILRKDVKKHKFKKLESIVRIVNSNGVEAARVTVADAVKLSALMEFDVCSFSGEIIWADENLKIGDDVFLSINVYLNPKVFHQRLEIEEDQDQKRRAKWDNYNETISENAMRLRQKSLAEVFQMVNLVSDRDVSDVKCLQACGQEDTLAELSKNQIDSFYQRSGQAAEQTLKETEPAKTFGYELRPYQKRGLTWMINREQGPDKEIEDDIMHPLWEKLEFPRSKIPFYVNLYSGDLSLEFPHQDSNTRGGILADEMGLGKTISTMAVIHSNSKPNAVTLLVVPMSLMSQWESEARSCSNPGTIDIFCYYGSRTSSFRSFIYNRKGLRLVITTYGTVAQDFEAHKKSGKGDKFVSLFDVTFDRVVLDEAHTIKNRTTLAAKACYEINAHNKWVLTGTPIINQLEDIYSLIKFLGIEPWNNHRFWRAFVTLPFQKKGYAQALNVVQSIVEPILLRRTKDMKQADGKPLIDLPEKTIRIERVQFSEDEEALYKFCLAQVRSQVTRELRERALAAYTQILTLIMRLRQICCHPTLASGINNADDLDGISGSQVPEVSLGSSELENILAKFDSSTYGQEMIKNIGTEDQICPICTEVIDSTNIALTECGHVSCAQCLLANYRFQRRKGEQPRCAVCREDIHDDSIWQVVHQEDDEIIQETKTQTIDFPSERKEPTMSHHDEGLSPTAGIQDQPGGTSPPSSAPSPGPPPRRVKLRKYKPLSAKVNALLLHLQDLPKGEKCVVFSQFTSFLDIIQDELIARRYKTLRFDGSLTQSKRKKVLDQFTEEEGSCILLLSLKAGGTGLNLVCARYAYMMDPWWSYAVEAQAIDRIHRMGQLHNVQVVRFIVEGSIEERMLKIQERKKLLAGSTLSMSEDERKQERLDEIRMLFEE